MSKVLFICSANKNRSVHAENLFSDHPFTSHHSYTSAGTVYSQVESAQRNRDNEQGSLYSRPKKLLLEALEECDIAYVMEDHHREIMQQYLSEYYPASLPLLSKVRALGIEDEYNINIPNKRDELTQILQKKLFDTLSGDL